ncbi:MULTISPECIES: acyl-CoA dehydrogenase family protein [unclassified Streptomyces]|uniref:acyl-CoA dehydrogenase family protein n=1 Tax=unclassified Streptomyces TaxID=2593676 RepID=UPI00224F51D6|nr:MULTISPECIES: acyl-CoA dehydrogenase family protein [unclassified Streptomyces]WSP55654.1 acyl-CoA dehydrogenase family protein [Streptomyces sp. NBC_01241]WSU23610.1 acyl-CoA dehydrogenase family protein [Streptomyces sp. NBC_01108]MCX4787352.1 acyl-CoA dehydrogenase family protein [Streptomyces sp. NBC_01221]MCX4796863.1 acyl-CoA dehydrogenase family protein [Streptomyces sp. NBC_01242]WSJ38077.1 acyl-CoA dehydrogenase family protein [Streptomyces sp. NBC_01321]
MTVHTQVEEEFSGLLEKLDEIYPLLQSEAADSERLRRPTPVVQDALRDSGIFKLHVPAELGGMEASPLQVLHVVEKLSHADASLGWLVRAVTSETATAATYLGDEAVTELFADGGCPLVAGQSTSFTGRAVRVDGGYRVSGVWQFAPGVSMATHLNLAATVEETGERLVCLVPRSAVRISDNWEMLGLRATASLDYRAEDVLVEDKYVFGIGPENARRGRSTHWLSPALLAGLHQAAWSQGVGRRMLDELRELTRRKDPAEGSLVTSDEFFGEFARHFSHVRGTMALLRDTLRDNESTLAAGAQLNDEQETMSRLACSLATRTALEISQLVHRFAGAQVMRDGVLQRFFRDSHAGSQHRGSSHIVTQKCGRMLSGTLPAGSHWGFFDLVVPEPAATDA